MALPAEDAPGRAAPAAFGTGPRGPAVAAFAAATFLGASLLFLVQPLIARYILPWFGGGPAVWTTCMLFFQTVLLGGYAYAHVGVRAVATGRLTARRHAVVHVALLLAAVAALAFVVPSPAWKPQSAGNPTLRILALLAVTVGLPYLALSATGPLLQAWFARLDRTGDGGGNAARTYRLYAVSNAGSLLALLAYPFVAEPLLSRRQQMAAWSAGLIGFAVLCAACAVLAARRAPRVNGDGHAGRTPAVGGSGPSGDIEPAGPTFARRSLWLALPTCASVLLLAGTNTLTQDVAPVPLLWVLPLALYLLTFILAFDRPGWYRRPVWVTLMVLVMLPAVRVLAVIDGQAPPMLLRTLVLAAVVLVCCMVCHGELARLKPPPRHLTGYYLTIAAGGAAGGMLVAVVGPLVLDRHVELHVGLWACGLLALLVPWATEGKAPRGVPGMMAVTGLVVLGGLLWAVAAWRPGDTRVVHRSRDFYGALTVDLDRPDDPAAANYRFFHGSILHGRQYLAPARQLVPTSYYVTDSGIGMALRQDRLGGRSRRVGVVGLGAGMVAAYGRAGDVFRFYELSPAVARLARDPFTFLRDTPARTEVVVGDGRLALEREPDQRFDVLALDAFSGDAVPVHLLTAEAFDVYRRHLAPGGLLGAHISNRYLDLQPVLKRWADHAGWDAVVVAQTRNAQTPKDTKDDAPDPSTWVLMAADPARLDGFRAAGGRPPVDRPGVKLWTDERSDLLRVLK